MLGFAINFCWISLRRYGFYVKCCSYLVDFSDTVYLVTFLVFSIDFWSYLIARRFRELFIITPMGVLAF